jgi:hypothetical protein
LQRGVQIAACIEKTSTNNIGGSIKQESCQRVMKKTKELKIWEDMISGGSPKAVKHKRSESLDISM